MKKNNKLMFLISALLIAIFHNLDVDWYVKDFILPFSIMIIDYLILFKDKDINKKGYLYLIPIVLILISDGIVQIDEYNMDLNIIMIPILIVALIFTLTNKNFNLKNNIFSWIFKVFPTGLFSNLKYLKSENKEKKNTFNIFLGIVLSIFLAIVILSLLTEADSYFSSFLNKLFFIDQLNLDSIFIFALAFIILFSIYINFNLNTKTEVKDKELLNTDKSIIKIVLITLNVIYLIFMISELSKLTNNFLNLPIRYTYASYAREGFFQILLVTLINFIIIHFITYKTNKAWDKDVKVLLYILIGFSILLIFNSYYRMSLYISNYHFTILRMQVVLFLLMELILFSYLIVKIKKKLENNNTFCYILLIVTYIINLYVCNEWVIEFVNKLIR